MNPDGQSSAPAPLNVTAAATLTFNTQGWNPPFTVGDSAATLPFQITNTSNGPITGTIIAGTNGGGSWLTVDGLASEKWVISGGALNTAGISVTANPTSLSPGTYTGSLSVSAPNASNPTSTIPVSMAIYPRLQITTSNLPDAIAGQSRTHLALASTGGTGSGYVWALTARSERYTAKRSNAQLTDRRH